MKFLVEIETDYSLEELERELELALDSVDRELDIEVLEVHDLTD